MNIDTGKMKYYSGLMILIFGIMCIGAGIGYEVGFRSGLHLNPQEPEILSDKSWNCYPIHYSLNNSMGDMNQIDTFFNITKK